MKVEWFNNGKKLKNGNSLRKKYDFGFDEIDIL
jgi:hypothetical protein